MSDIYFDTNIIIDALARRPQALAELHRAKRQWISRMTWIEVLAGMPVPARAETEAYLQNYAIRELSPEIARRAADLRFNKRSLKLPDAFALSAVAIGELAPRGLNTLCPVVNGRVGVRIVGTLPVVI